MDSHVASVTNLLLLTARNVTRGRERLARIMAAGALLFIWTGLGSANEAYTEPVTGKTFPATVSFSHNGKTHTLTITGFTVRRKFFLSIYSIAHYMQSPNAGQGQDILTTILQDDAVKQITMDFARDVSAERIQDALVEGFHTNATDTELREIEPLVEEFAIAVNKDAKESDQFVIRWLPGGTTISLFQGETVSTIHSVTFARVLWSIWFGERSIVNRNALIDVVGQSLGRDHPDSRAHSPGVKNTISF